MLVCSPCSLRICNPQRILSEFVIRQAITNRLNIGYGLQIRIQRGRFPKPFGAYKIAIMLAWVLTYTLKSQ